MNVEPPLRAPHLIDYSRTPVVPAWDEFHFLARMFIFLGCRFSMSKIKERAGQKNYDAVVIGAGPNGLSAAIVLAQRGASVLVLEGRDTVGGGCRTAEYTLPGFKHDICSSVYPLGAGSPFFRTLPLDKFGLEWIHPEVAYAHPLDGGDAVAVWRSVERTAENMGRDAEAYRNLMDFLVPDWDYVCDLLRNPWRLALHPLAMARFGLMALNPTIGFARMTFETARAQAAFAGVAAHSSLKLEEPASASFGLVLGLTAHAVGWPMPKGGAQNLVDALAGYLQSLGGEILTGAMVESLNDMPPSKYIFCDLTPKQILKLAGDSLKGFYRKQLESYKYGCGVFKVDWALDAPVPWQSDICRKAGTLHLGGGMEEIALSERLIWRGQASERPYVLAVQNSLFDASRAPPGKHTLWTYCHVPNAYARDITDRIEAQVERFAPGFKETVIGKHTMSPVDYEMYNPNMIGGDINGGALSLDQLFTRPVLRAIPFSTARKGLYICSSSSPPGGGVHGMCGYYAAHVALRGLS